MGVELITCPSGLSGRIRGMKTREANLLADRAALARARRGQGDPLDEVLAACWESTDNPGPYKPSPNGQPAWFDVLVGDHFFAMLRLRVATFGPLYSFARPCLTPGCKGQIRRTIDVVRDLPVQPYPAASLEAFRSGERLCSSILGDQRRVWFQLLTRRLARQVRDDVVQRGDVVTYIRATLAARVVEVEGVPERNRVAFLSSLDIAEAMPLLEGLYEHDGGVNTTMHLTCVRCCQDMRVNVPFDASFFLPSERFN